MLPRRAFCRPARFPAYFYVRHTHLAAAAAPSLQGYLTGLGGNSLLLSYFASKREANAVVVQALGILSSFAVLTQIRAAGHMPRLVYAALAALVGLQVGAAVGVWACTTRSLAGVRPSLPKARQLQRWL